MCRNAVLQDCFSPRHLIYFDQNQLSGCHSPNLHSEVVMDQPTPQSSETGGTTRRTFLGAAALTAASYQRILGANDRIGVGFIGYGLIGKQHVTDFKKFPDVDIVGLCDVYKPRVEE